MRLRSGDAGGIRPGSGFDWSLGMRADPERRRIALGALSLLVLLGAVLRWWGAGQDLYADEVATYWDVSTTDLPGLIRLVSSTAEITPPLGFVLSWLTTQPDLSVETLRLPSLVAGVASIPLVYAVGVRTVGRGAGLLASALTTFSPFMIFYSIEARPYAVMTAMVLLSTLSMLKAIDGGRKRWWAAYAAFICLAAYAHYTAAFVLAAQFAWVLVTQARARWPASIATLAAVMLYIPWLPSLKGDLDSPTTAILDAALGMRFNVGSVLDDAAHWLVGFPFWSEASLGTLPGRPALLLLACSAFVGATGIYSYRGRLSEWFGEHDNRVVLVAVLAIATPVLATLESILSTNVFLIRNLAASWPYAALTFAALVTVGEMARRLLAAALAIAALGLGAAMVVSDDYRRPSFSEAAQFAGENGGVLVDAASFTPGPLANFDLEGSRPDVPVIRLSLPAEKTAPFDLFDQPTPPAEVAEEAVAAAEGGPINLVTSNASAAWGGPSNLDAGNTFVAALPDYYTEAESRVFPGVVDLKVTVFEAESEGAGRP